MSNSFILELTQSPILAVIVGGALATSGGFLTNYWGFWREQRQKASATLAAIRAEILSIVTLMEEADYAKGLQNQIDFIEKYRRAAFFEIPVKIELFTRVYTANLSNLGLLDAKLLPDIVSFYATIHGLVMDLEHTKPQSEVPGLAENLLKIYKFDLRRVNEVTALGKRIAANYQKTQIS